MASAVRKNQDMQGSHITKSLTVIFTPNQDYTQYKVGQITSTLLQKWLSNYVFETGCHFEVRDNPVDKSASSTMFYQAWNFCYRRISKTYFGRSIHYLLCIAEI